ncbi:MAG: FG-GAP repeat domain-containing protein [Pyrinomonadaceae bacterium]
MKNVFLLKLATVLCSVLCTTLMGYGVFAADFPANAGTLGAIPDYPVNAGGCHVSGWVDKNVTFTVSGITGAPSNVEIKNLTFSPTHTWAGDVTALLIAPGGAPTASVFGRIGATTATGAGTASDLTGPYGFRNPADPNIWSVAATNPIPSNTYAATISGGVGTTNPAATVNLDTAFAGVANPNGTWTLRFRDGCDGDTGSVSAVTLTVDGAAVPANAPHDINGDGRSDFIIVRGDGAPLAEYMGANDFAGKDKVGNNQRQAKSAVPQVGVGWWTALNNGSAPTRVDLGTDTDFFVNEDFDGDGRDDLTVYSPGAATVAAFRILRSSNSTVLTIPYGQSGDDPSVVGDWNNDNVADLAVYRDGTGGSPQSFFFWTSIATPSVVNYLPWGQDGDIGFALDYDGDGRLDPAIQRNSAGAGIFWISRSSNSATVTFQYGLSSDFVLPGDYDGDGREDIVVSRNANFGAGTFKYFWILESDGGGAPNTPQQWGIPGDFICQGDYDGDGRTDLAVWRSNPDPSMNYFYARRSSDGATHQFEWGQSGDYPVNNWRVY